MGLFRSQYYSEYNLINAGFKSVGENVLIDSSCIIIGEGNISIGSNVRIDAFTTITAAGDGFLNIGSNVHIAGYVLLACSAGMTLEDFTSISHGSKLFTASDDYTGKGLVNPTIPDKYRSVRSGPIHMKRHALIGSMTVVLPNVTIGTGTSVGAMSKVVSSLDDWGVYAGSPAVRIKDRHKEIIRLEKEYLEEFGG